MVEQIHADTFPVGWVASMSDGTTVFQGPDVDGELTHWQKLRHQCFFDGELHITQIQLQSKGHTYVAIPNADGYVAFYESKMSLTKPGRPQKLYQGVGAVFGDFVFITMTNHQGTWRSDVRSLASMRPHCQLKPADARRRADARPQLIMPTSQDSLPVESSFSNDALSEEEIWDDELRQLLEWYEKNSIKYKDSSIQLLAFIMTSETGILVDAEIAQAIRKRYA